MLREGKGGANVSRVVLEGPTPVSTSLKVTPPRVLRDLGLPQGYRLMFSAFRADKQNLSAVNPPIHQ